jgi:hypothetical protein
MGQISEPFRVAADAGDFSGSTHDESDTVQSRVDSAAEILAAHQQELVDQLDGEMQSGFFRAGRRLRQCVILNRVLYRRLQPMSVEKFFGALLALTCVLCVGVLVGEEPDSPKPASRTNRKIEGWTVRVDDRLFSPPHDTLGARTLKLLEAKLADITYVVAKERLEKLQAVTIVLDLTHGKLRAMQYHPDAGWLEANGYARDLAKCVHIPEAADLPTPRNIREQPWVVLHELAHAYHDQVLGFDETRIREAYERFKKSGHGDAALLYNGQRVRHYGLTDHKEFFAEMTEAYFGMDDFFPFNRAELMTAEPEIYELLRTIWEPGNGSGDAAIQGWPAVGVEAQFDEFLLQQFPRRPFQGVIDFVHQ